MAELTIGIIGLGRLGSSIGLALKRYNESKTATNHFTVIGNDALGSIEKEARELDAVDEIASQPASAAEDKDIVVIATPYAETRAAFRAIARSLREGAVIFDLSPLKVPSMNWAKDTFPDGVHLVGGTAVVNPIYLWDGLDDTHHARADLFDSGQMLLAPAPSADQAAVELITQFSELLGSTTHFIDPAEHDGLIAATEGLPALLGVAAFRAMAGGAGWSEVQRLTNPAFGRITHRIMDTHPDDLRDLVTYNRDNTLRHLDSVIENLTALRSVIADEDTDAIEAAFVDAENRYQGWLKRRSQGAWDNLIDEERPSVASSMLSGMLGGFLANRLRGQSDDNGK